ncbi:MAG: class I SAM-dependent methyltransferase [Gemmatimonadales bacterium]|jgi:glycine/sarcosine N-methyltransferase
MCAAEMYQDPYETFAERYELFYEKFDEPDGERIQFFQELFEQFGVRHVLDCACGTGNDLYWLHEAGKSVVGADVSRPMLQRAGRNLDAYGIHIPLVRADFRASPFRPGSFDAVLCLTTSLPHLADRDEVRAALRNMHGLLREGGVLVLSQGMTDKMLRDRPRFIPEINRTDMSRVFVIDYADETVVIHVLDLVHEPGNQEFFVDSFEYIVLLPVDYTGLLSDAGFSDVNCFSGFSTDPYDPECSNRLVVVGRK